MTRRTLACASCLFAAWAGTAVVASTVPAAMGRSDAIGAPAQAGTPELLFDQGKRNFDAFQYDQAVPLFNAVIQMLTANGQIQKPDLLVQTYERRARARFALGDSPGAEQDFSALLTIQPGFKLGEGISPRVVALFDSVKKLTIGRVLLSMTPAGDAQIDGKAMAVPADPPLALDLPAGEHQLTASRPGYRAVAQKFTVAPGSETPMPITLERVSATLSVVSIPDDVEVLLDGESRGRTKAGGDAATGASAPLVLGDLTPGSHTLLLRRSCYKEVTRAVTIDKPSDVSVEPLKLTQAVATVKLQSAERGAAIFVDGAARGQAPSDLTVCEGSHLIEVKGPKGRFVDRRDWKTGDAVTLTADLRSAFPIVFAKGGAGLTVEQLRINVERALAPAKRVLVYMPADTELDAALKAESIPPDWLSPDAGAAPGSTKIPKDTKRDLIRRLTTRLQTQGVAMISAGPDPYMATVSLIATGSAEPDVITINMSDAASQTRAAEALGAPLPPLVRPSIESIVIDLAGVKGAVVVRPGGVGAKAGLVAGDIITAAGGSPVNSVADLRAKIAAIHPPATDLPLDVKNTAGATRKVNGIVAMAPDTIPLQDQTLPYNRALIELQESVRTTTVAVDKAVARVSLAIVHMRLGNWDDALTELKDAQLPEGAGVSAGTVAYLSGLCFEALGRAPEARTAFTKAAASPDARLSSEGPLLAPLAQQKLTRSR